MSFIFPKHIYDKELQVIKQKVGGHTKCYRNEALKIIEKKFFWLKKNRELSLAGLRNIFWNFSLLITFVCRNALLYNVSYGKKREIRKKVLVSMDRLVKLYYTSRRVQLQTKILDGSVFNPVSCLQEAAHFQSRDYFGSNLSLQNISWLRVLGFLWILLTFIAFLKIMHTVTFCFSHGFYLFVSIAKC